MKQTIGFIGTGLMGAPMAARLLSAGHSLHVYNRTKEKAEPLVQSGAVWHDSPAAVAQHSAVVFTMLTNDQAVRIVADQVRSALPAGGIHVDCSTVSGTLTDALEQEYTSTGRNFLHSPVLGSIPQAADGTLLLFVGGRDDAFASVEPLLRLLSSKLWRFPNAPAASNTKLTMNSFIGGMIATLSQALVFAQTAGIGGEVILDILSNSALGAPTYQTKGASILQGNFAPRFVVENLLKDTNLFIDAARTAGTPAPVAEMVRRLLEKTIASGFGQEDYSAIVKAF